MAEKLQIIYTSETDDFRLSDFELFISHRHSNDPLLQKLRDNYQRLRHSFLNLPNKVGVVTYPDCFKRDSREFLDEIEGHTSTYQPLELMDRALKLKNEDMDNPIARQYVDRALSVIISHPALCMDPEIRNRAKFYFLTAIGSSQMVLAALRKPLNGSQITESTEYIQRELKEAERAIKEAYPGFEELDDMNAFILERFQRNRVSRNFPLYFLPKDGGLTNFYSVSLAEGIETPDFVEGMLKYIRLGCEVQGLNKIPDSVQAEIDSWSKDLFGQTKRANSLDELLSSLPQPQTIITDTYIVDRFPQLAEIDFDAHEFKLLA